MALSAQTILHLVAGGNEQLEQIAKATGSPKHDVVKAIQRIKKRGLIEIKSSGVYALTAEGVDWVKAGKVIKAGQGKRPRTATRGLRQRAWWVIRARRSFTVPELLSTLADGSEKGASSNLSSYIGPLVKAGFLNVSTKRDPGQALTSPGHRRYQIARDNGRLAPVIRQKDRVVFDPNTEETFPMGDVQ